MKRIRLKSPNKKLVNIVIRLALGAILLGLLFAVVYLSTGPSIIRLYEGDISLRDIYAPYDFTYTGDIDEAAMEKAEKSALSRINPVCINSPQIRDAVGQNVSAFFGHVRDSQRRKEIIGDDAKLKRLEKISNLKLSNQTYLTLIRQEGIDSLEELSFKIIDQSLKEGILSASDKAILKEDGVLYITILDPSDNTERTESVDVIPTLDEFNASLERRIADRLPRDKKLRLAMLEVLNTFASSNLEFSPSETEGRQEAVLARLPTIYRKNVVKKNEILIGKGEKATKRHLNMLKQLGEARGLSGRFFYLVGMGLLLVIFLLISVFYLRFYESRIFRNNKNLLLISLLVLYTALIAEAVVISPLSSYFIPLASASMLIAILLDANSAFIFTFVMSIFIGVVAGNNFGLMIVMFIGSSIGIYSVRKVRRRYQLLLAGFLVGIVNLLAIIAFNLLNNLDPRLFFAEGIWGVVNGLTAFLLVIGLLPVLEYVFKIPTDITLLELSDLNHSLLKEMATKAPGTYYHSLIVGNLAETACDAIGANSLLARVGAYYHDIGKIEKAEYFSENEAEPKNSRHEGLTASMSALVIINHVKDGIELARKYKLNQALVDFIAQHHGNGLIYYFYQRALEKIDDERQLKEEEFRYPGPRPQSKEAAIVLLADSVEASSRTLANPTPSRVQGLVQRIINNKFIDGQLDECDLTLKNLHKISEAFMRILNAMFHTRVEYPDEKERYKHKNNNKKSDKKTDSKNRQNREDNREGA